GLDEVCATLFNMRGAGTLCAGRDRVDVHKELPGAQNLRRVSHHIERRRSSHAGNHELRAAHALGQAFARAYATVARFRKHRLAGFRRMKEDIEYRYVDALSGEIGPEDAADFAEADESDALDGCGSHGYLKYETKSCRGARQIASHLWCARSDRGTRLSAASTRLFAPVSFRRAKEPV